MTKEEVPERVINFKKLNDQIKRHFADIMLVTMNILLIQYNKARGGERSSPAGARFEETSRERVITLYICIIIKQEKKLKNL